jgi:2-polyprenyl-3-methyl-5-hydroxy-6-metoxy-1,4-benzoquinol methylase
MLEEATCNLCGANRCQVLFDASPEDTKGFEDFVYTITDDRIIPAPRLARCLRCGLIYVSSGIKAQAFYAKYRDMRDATYLSEEKGRRLSARIMLDRIMKFKPAGRLLDIGCATGLLLDEARKLGWETAGVELSRWAAGIAREKLKLAVFEGLLKEAKYPEQHFDAVVMMDVIEHLPDPRGTLGEISNILKPDGILCVSTPDVGSIASRLLRAKWWGVRMEHIFYFSKQSLTGMLDAAGFEIINCRSHVRIFSLKYLSARLRRYPVWLYFLLTISTKLFLDPEKLITVNLADQIEVYARKKPFPA